LVVPPAIIAGSLVFRVIFSVSQLWNILGSFTEPFSYYQLKKLEQNATQYSAYLHQGPTVSFNSLNPYPKSNSAMQP